ncbi:MAG: cytochrome c [Gammaproteobacteria bacterium]|nr:cytochrome c [Gammaproteobacteria bacterium]
MRAIAITCSLLALSFAGAAGAAVAKPVRVVVCGACHGEDGKAKMPMYPNLAGQYRSYLEQALRAYRSGARKNPIMNAQAGGLTDADIQALALWYSSRPPALYTPSVSQPFTPSATVAGE